MVEKYGWGDLVSEQHERPELREYRKTKADRKRIEDIRHQIIDYLNKVRRKDGRKTAVIAEKFSPLPPEAVKTLLVESKERGLVYMVYGRWYVEKRAWDTKDMRVTVRVDTHLCTAYVLYRVTFIKGGYEFTVWKTGYILGRHPASRVAAMREEAKAYAAEHEIEYVDG